MCCSRVESTPTRHSRPAMSLAFPMKRPGAARTPLRFLASRRTPKSPNPGPPKLGAKAKCCASPTIILAPLAPKSMGALRPPSASSKGSITAIDCTPQLRAKSVSSSTASRRPKVLPCGNTIAAKRSAASAARALRLPKLIQPDWASTGTKMSSTSVPSAKVFKTSRSPGYKVSGTKAAERPRVSRMAAAMPSKMAEARSYKDALTASNPVNCAIAHW